MGVARFKVFPGHDAQEQAEHLAKTYAMDFFSYNEIDEETDRFGITTKIYELHGLRRSDCEALTKDRHVCQLVEALAAGDLPGASAAWSALAVEANLEAAREAQAEGKRNPWSRP